MKVWVKKCSSPGRRKLCILKVTRNCLRFSEIHTWGAALVNPWKSEQDSHRLILFQNLVSKSIRIQCFYKRKRLLKIPHHLILHWISISGPKAPCFLANIIHPHQKENKTSVISTIQKGWFSIAIKTFWARKFPRNWAQILSKQRTQAREWAPVQKALMWTTSIES